MSEAVRCDGVDFAYNGTRVLQDVTFGVAAGEFIGLIGANGSGKSTLLRLLLGMLTPTAGRIEVLGQAPLAAVRGGFVGYVPQRDARASSTPLSAYDVVLLGRAGCVGLGRRPRVADRELARAALVEVGAGDFATASFGQLSGGQQRLVLVARALVQEPALLLLDEADTGLDERHRTEVYHLLNARRQRTGMTIVAISHQFDLLSTVVDSALALRDGRAIDWCPEHMTHALAAHEAGA